MAKNFRANSKYRGAPVAHDAQGKGYGELEATWEALKSGWSGLRGSLEDSRQELHADPSWTQVLYPFSTTDTEEQREALLLDRVPRRDCQARRRVSVPAGERICPCVPCA